MARSDYGRNGRSKTTLMDKRVPKPANRTGKVSEGNIGIKKGRVK